MAIILITHGVPAAGFAALGSHRLIIPEPLRALSREELAARLPEADAVVACGRLNGELIRLGTRLRVIANYGAGYDAVDVTEAARLGVPVTNIPDVTADATAELAVGLMLAVSRRIAELNLRLRREPSSGLFGLGVEMGRTLRGQTLGVLGMGRIGSRVATLARGFGMEVLGYCRHGADPTVAEPVGLAELLARSDVLTLHCPLTAQTRGLIGREAIGQMKPGAVLINTSRGAVVDHEALADALSSGHLSAAGLDVFPEEPSIPARLLAMKQVVLTPHIGTNTAQTRDEMARACAHQILDALAGRLPGPIVNGVTQPRHLRP